MGRTSSLMLAHVAEGGSKGIYERFMAIEYSPYFTTESEFRKHGNTLWAELTWF